MKTFSLIKNLILTTAFVSLAACGPNNAHHSSKHFDNNKTPTDKPDISRIDETDSIEGVTPPINVFASSPTLKVLPASLVSDAQIAANYLMQVHPSIRQYWTASDMAKMKKGKLYARVRAAKETNEQIFIITPVKIINSAPDIYGYYDFTKKITFEIPWKIAGEITVELILDTQYSIEEGYGECTSAFSCEDHMDVMWTRSSISPEFPSYANSSMAYGNPPSWETNSFDGTTSSWENYGDSLCRLGHLVYDETVFADDFDPDWEAQ